MSNSLFNYNSRKSKELRIGDLLLGGNNPVRIQTMANTDTNDIKKSTSQAIRTIEAGTELLRYTTQGIREVESLRLIKSSLRFNQYTVPLVADIHFSANAAFLAAQYVEKVRINPGNFVKGIKRAGAEYSEEEFTAEYEMLASRFIELLAICKEHNTAIRIGVNHGSLSERMMNRYGDTSQGMVESCMELLRIASKENFDNIVISMKTSNTVFMVHTVRLLVAQMEKEGFDFPLHLGVTEAGDGEDGRIKSAVGIGALLVDGIGDTIRVSLSEDPEFEIPVARTLVDYVEERQNHKFIEAEENLAHKRFEYARRTTHAVKNIGGKHLPVVVATDRIDYKTKPDYLISDDKIFDFQGNEYALYKKSDLEQIEKNNSELIFLELNYEQTDQSVLDCLLKKKNIVILLRTNHKNGVGEQRAFFHLLMNQNCSVPVILSRRFAETEVSDLQIKAATDLGVMFIDGFGDGILIENSGEIAADTLNALAFGILQATRVRIFKTDYISCPGCGRTLFDLQSSIARVKKETSHLKGLKIAIMGCIVNGPGEMADADYGYVGAGPGKVHIYKKQECIERNVSEKDAVDKLLNLINKDEN